MSGVSFFIRLAQQPTVQGRSRASERVSDMLKATQLTPSWDLNPRHSALETAVNRGHPLGGRLCFGHRAVGANICVLGEGMTT